MRSCPWVFWGLLGTGIGAGLLLTFCLLSSRTVHYNPTSTKHFSFSVGAVPPALQPQLGVLRYFASYMEQRLMKVCGLEWDTLRIDTSRSLPVPLAGGVEGSELEAEPLRDTWGGLTHISK